MTRTLTVDQALAEVEASNQGYLEWDGQQVSREELIAYLEEARQEHGGDQQVGVYPLQGWTLRK